MSIDLSRLPAPDMVEPLDFETILATIKADFLALAPDMVGVLALESEPVTKLCEVLAWREFLLRARVNDAGKSVMLAYARGGDLDQIAAGYNVTRQVIAPADLAASPPVPAVLETDADLRRRVQLAFEGFSTAGPGEAYVFHALSAHPDVLDASVASPSPGDVVVTVLSRSGDGVPAAAVLAAVNAALNAERVRPLTDHVTVQPAVVVNWTLTATLILWTGPDTSIVKASALANIDDYLSRQQRLGRSIHRSALLAALHVEGVKNVILTSPAADIAINAAQCGHCTDISVTAAAG